MALLAHTVEAVWEAFWVEYALTNYFCSCWVTGVFLCALRMLLGVGAWELLPRNCMRNSPRAHNLSRLVDYTHCRLNRYRGEEPRRGFSEKRGLRAHRCTSFRVRCG